MRAVFGLVLVVGLALAGAAVYMAQGFVARTQAERNALMAQMAKQVPLATVLVVKADKAYGDTITAEDVVAIRYQADHQPAGAFADIKALFPEGKPQTRTALRAMDANEPVLASKVTEPGEDAGLTSRLTKGMRAFTVTVDVSSGVSGFLRPGDRVDVYWTGEQEGTQVSKLIDTGVKLIAVDQTADQDRSVQAQVARTVTVEATSEQVAALALAQSTGRLTLALVGTNDTTTVGAVEIDRARLLGIEKPVVAEVAAPRVCTIRTNKGGEIVQVEIPCTN
ncbi:Flp pilus assembly protein CpaB [Frigidibacter sp. MR17.14]|uniref:Flp pilus assembly protein CpaB n=1 Tax=Frigidibacter sp. MR17.14 TaxID=3126509 RepID=UPI003012A0E5